MQYSVCQLSKFNNRKATILQKCWLTVFFCFGMQGCRTYESITSVDLFLPRQSSERLSSNDTWSPDHLSVSSRDHNAPHEPLMDAHFAIGLAGESPKY